VRQPYENKPQPAFYARPGWQQPMAYHPASAQQPYNANAQQTVYAQQTVSKQEAKRKRTTTENWVGRNVLGIAASVLVFIGLIFLGRLIYEKITDEIKIVLMFVLSTVITGLGVFLCKKTRNAFTVILTGCGCGSYFIAIILTHTYFGKMNGVFFTACVDDIGFILGQKDSIGVVKHCCAHWYDFFDMLCVFGAFR